jgi:hypothetical protein
MGGFVLVVGHVRLPEQLAVGPVEAEQRALLARATPPLPPLGGQTLSLAWVTKTLSPQMTGVELPLSGSATFQRTFSEGPHLVGRSFSAH